MRTGVQLYSLRNYISENGLEKALELISEAGFEGVEFAGFYNKSVEEIQTLLDKYNLKAISVHVAADNLTEKLPYIKGLKMESAVIPKWKLDDKEQFDRLVEMLPEILKQFKENGLKLGYHNHAHEFSGGNDYVTALAEKFPSLKLEPDVFWLAVAGIDAEKFLTRHKDKLLYLHIKELGEGGVDDANPVVGEGKANIKRVLELGKEFGVEWAILEIEKVDMPWNEYLKKSNKFIKTVLCGEEN